MIMEPDWRQGLSSGLKIALVPVWLIGPAVPFALGFRLVGLGATMSSMLAMIAWGAILAWFLSREAHTTRIGASLDRLFGWLTRL
mgnify:CR=1 FL=1